MKILISIIVPLYNYRKYIGYCIKSILDQTYKNFELIVVDDCSTDGSYEEAKRFKKKDSRVKVIRLNKNKGYSTAKNEGIVISKGEYIVTLDADDMMTKESLEIRLKAILEKKVPFVYADAITVYNKISLKECYKLNLKKLKKKKILHVASYFSSDSVYQIHAQGVMVHRSIYIKYGLYDENLRSRSDREMWWRLFGKDEKDNKKIEAYHLSEAVAYYRFHRYSMWRKRKRNPERDKQIIKMSKKAYNMRKEEGITKKNTRFLED